MSNCCCPKLNLKTLFSRGYQGFQYDDPWTSQGLNCPDYHSQCRGSCKLGGSFLWCVQRKRARRSELQISEAEMWNPPFVNGQHTLVAQVSPFHPTTRFPLYCSVHTRVMCSCPLHKVLMMYLWNPGEFEIMSKSQTLTSHINSKYDYTRRP